MSRNPVQLSHHPLPRAPLGLVAAWSALALALTACSSDAAGPGSNAAADGEAAGDASGEELSQEELSALVVDGPVPANKPEVDASALPAEPDSSAPVSERVAWFLLTDVSTKAAHIDPDAVAACPEDLRNEPGQSGTCTLTYGGLPMEFPVESEDEYGDVAFRFEYPELPSVREVVEDTIRFEHDVEAVHCAMEDVVAVEPGEDPAPYFCYARDGGIPWVDSPEDTVSAYEVYVLDGGSVYTYQYLGVD